MDAETRVQQFHYMWLNSRLAKIHLVENRQAERAAHDEVVVGRGPLENAHTERVFRDQRSTCASVNSKNCREASRRCSSSVSESDNPSDHSALPLGKRVTRSQSGRQGERLYAAVNESDRERYSHAQDY